MSTRRNEEVKLPVLAIFKDHFAFARPCLKTISLFTFDFLSNLYACARKQLMG